MTDERPAIKHCPRCTFGQMIERTNSKSGAKFLGCDQYERPDADGKPTCSHTEPLPQYMLMRRSGAPELPGFGDL